MTALSTEPASACSPGLTVHTSRTDLSLGCRNIPRPQFMNAHLVAGVLQGSLRDSQAVARLEVGAPQVGVHILQGQLHLRQVQGTCHVRRHACKV